MNVLSITAMAQVSLRFGPPTAPSRPLRWFTLTTRWYSLTFSRQMFNSSGTTGPAVVISNSSLLGAILAYEWSNGGGRIDFYGSLLLDADTYWIGWANHAIQAPGGSMLGSGESLIIVVVDSYIRGQGTNDMTVGYLTAVGMTPD